MRFSKAGAAVIFWLLAAMGGAHAQALTPALLDTRHFLFMESKPQSIKGDKAFDAVVKEYIRNYANRCAKIPELTTIEEFTTNTMTFVTLHTVRSLWNEEEAGSPAKLPAYAALAETVACTPCGFNYSVVRASSAAELSAKIKMVLQTGDGWELQGGVSVSMNGQGEVYAQAVVTKPLPPEPAPDSKGQLKPRSN
jgi:hypothetical protein